MTDSPTGCYRLLDVDDAEGVDTFQPTAFSASGWGPNMQHAGPVAALLTRAMEAYARPGARISRVGVDILGAVPLSTLRVRGWVERPGRRIELLAASMLAQQPDGDFRLVATARAWQLATQPTDDVAHRGDPAVPAPDLASPNDSGLLDAWRNGFVNALQWHLEGVAAQPGTPTMGWLRLIEPLVLGEQVTDLQRVMAIADTANGVGARLDAREWTFLNTDLSVLLFDPPVGEWIGLQSEMSVGHDGIAMTSAVIHALAGPIGRLNQNVLVQRRAN